MKKLSFLFAFLFLNFVTAHGATYYVDPNGNDASNGSSTATPWKTLEKVSSVIFSPDDKILFKAGGIWNGVLKPKGSGAEGHPIIIDKYDEGHDPILNGNGTAIVNADKTVSQDLTGTVVISDVSYWEINHLEVTNRGETYAHRAGIYVNNSSANKLHHIFIRNCFVHDVNSRTPPHGSKMNGGIIITGMYDDLLVDSCHVKDVQTEGIRTGGKGSSNVRFTHNLVENVFGDGMVLAGAEKGGYAAYNRLINCCITHSANYAGLWLIASRNTIVEYNEVSNQTGGYMFDGEAFDDDLDCNGDIFQYNYSHDNAGGFFLAMPSAHNFTVRFNVSQNDGFGGRQELLHITNISGNNQFYNNTFYIGPKVSTNLFNDLGTVANHKVVNFYNNIVYCDGKINAFSGTGFNPQSQFKNNCFYPIEKFKNTQNYFANQQNLITANPLFVAPGKGGNGFATLGGYALQPNSPCLRGGMMIPNNGGRDFLGTNISNSPSVSIGAFWESNRK